CSARRPSRWSRNSGTGRGTRHGQTWTTSWKNKQASRDCKRPELSSGRLRSRLAGPPGADTPRLAFARDSGPFTARLLQLLEVGFDGVAILGGHTASQVSHGLGTLLLRKLAPHISVLLELLDINVATPRRSVRYGAVFGTIARWTIAVRHS